MKPTTPGTPQRPPEVPPTELATEEERIAGGEEVPRGAVVSKIPPKPEIPSVSDQTVELTSQPKTIPGQKASESPPINPEVATRRIAKLIEENPDSLSKASQYADEIADFQKE